MSWSTAQREAALVALAASATDGTPRFSAVASKLGMPKSTLIFWWKAHAPAAHAPAPGSVPTVAPDADRRTFLLEAIRSTQVALDGASKAGSWQAVGTLTRRLMDIRKDLDALDAAEAEANGPDESTVDAMTEDEFLERLRDVAKGTADAYLEVYVEEYLRRLDLLDAFRAWLAPAPRPHVVEPRSPEPTFPTVLPFTPPGPESP